MIKRITLRESLALTQPNLPPKYPRLNTALRFPGALLFKMDYNHDQVRMELTPLVEGADTPAVDGADIFNRFVEASKTIYEGGIIPGMEDLSPEDIEFAKSVGAVADQLFMSSEGDK